MRISDGSSDVCSSDLAEVARARESWAEWAARPLANRVETLRRFANVVRSKHEAFADTIARETGKPMWEARSEVDTVIAKVDISAKAYADRTSQRRLDAQMGSRMALRHKPHGVLAVLGPYNFPAHLPNGHIVPALIAGNAVVFKPSEKTPASGDFLVKCYHERSEEHTSELHFPPRGPSDLARDRQGPHLGQGLGRSHRAAPAGRADGIADGAAAQAARRARGARPLQFPRASAQRPHRPRTDRGQCRGLQAVRKDAGLRRLSRQMLSRGGRAGRLRAAGGRRDRKSTRLNSSH